MKKLLSILVVVLLIFTVVCPTNTVYAASKPKLNKTKLELNIGDTYTLKLSKATEVTWNSSDNKIATVTQTGVVTAISEGKAKIYARAGGKKYTCKITVKKQSVKTTLYKINEFLIRDVINESLGDIANYINVGCDNDLQPIDINAALADYRAALDQMGVYNSYIMSLPNADFEDLKDIWSDIYTEYNKVYDDLIVDTPSADNLFDSFDFNYYVDLYRLFQEELEFIYE